MHPPDGILRAWQDEALPPDEQAEIAGHLAACAACQRRADALSTRSRQVAAALATLAPPPHEAAPTSASAHARFQSRFTDSKEETPTMWSTFVRRYRPLVAGLAALLILTMMMALPPVRAAAADFLGIFRVQRIAVISLDRASLSGAEGGSAQLEQLLSDDVQVEPLGESQTGLSVKEASEAAGISVRLPQAAASDDLNVEAGARITLKVDLPRVRALLAEVRRTDITLPDSLDGATVVAELPPIVQSSFGKGCDSGAQDTDSSVASCMTLVQLASPTITAPPDLEIAELGEAFLQLLGMSREEAARFSATTDWATTLVVPLPHNGASYRDVQVDGVAGTLIQQSLEDQEPFFVLLWVKDGVVYGLAGAGAGEDALPIANSLR